MTWPDDVADLRIGRLELLTGWDDNAGSTEVVLLVRMPDGALAERRTTVARGEPLPTLVGLWAGADWWERVIAEGFGHPGREPLLRGASLRRDEPLVRRADPWPGSYDPGGKRSPRPLGAPS